MGSPERKPMKSRRLKRDGTAQNSRGKRNPSRRSLLVYSFIHFSERRRPAAFGPDGAESQCRAKTSRCMEGKKLKRVKERRRRDTMKWSLTNFRRLLSAAPCGESRFQPSA